MLTITGFFIPAALRYLGQSSQRTAVYSTYKHDITKSFPIFANCKWIFIYQVVKGESSEFLTNTGVYEVGKITFVERAKMHCTVLTVQYILVHSGQTYFHEESNYKKLI